MAGSADRKMLRTRNSPSEIIGTSASRSAKSVGCGIPLGRELSQTCRFFIAAAFPISSRFRGPNCVFRSSHHQLALGEETGAVLLYELVEVTDRRDHQRAFVTVQAHMMSNAVAFTGRSIAIEADGALAVEMRRRLILVQIGEDGSERTAAVEDVGRLGRATVHENVKGGVLSEERHLSACVTPVGAMGIGVDQFSDGEAVGRFFRSHGRVHGASCCRLEKVAEAT